MTDKLIQLCGETENEKNMNAIESLIKTGAKVNGTQIDQLRWSPLHWASYRENISYLKLLLDSGAKINLTDLEGFSALHVAVQHHRVRSVECLLGRGADVNMRTKSNQQSALDIAQVAMISSQSSQSSGIRAAAHVDAQSEVQTIVALLVKHGAKTHEDFKDRTTSTTPTPTGVPTTIKYFNLPSNPIASNSIAPITAKLNPAGIFVAEPKQDN